MQGSDPNDAVAQMLGKQIQGWETHITGLEGRWEDQARKPNVEDRIIKEKIGLGGDTQRKHRTLKYEER